MFPSSSGQLQAVHITYVYQKFILCNYALPEGDPKRVETGWSCNILNVNYIKWVLDKSLARPTSRCRGTESIVSLERGVCSCA